MANGLFMTPEQVMAAQQQAQQAQDIQAFGYSPQALSGAQIGRALAGAFGGWAGVPQQESPELKLAKTRQGVIQALDPNNLETFREGAKSLYAAGDVQGATSLLSQYNALKPKKGSGFTLGEGQIRYDEAGGIVARGPAKAKEGDKEERIGLFKTNPDGSVEQLDTFLIGQNKELPPLPQGQGLSYQKIAAMGTKAPTKVAGESQTKFDKFKYNKNRYDKMITPVKDSLSTISEVKGLISSARSGAVDKATTAKITELFSSNVRAVAELEGWKNLGSIGQRVSGAVERFLAGNRTESQYQDLVNLVNSYEKEIIKKSNNVKADVWDTAVASGDIDPESILNEPRYQEMTDKNGVIWRCDAFNPDAPCTEVK